MKIEEVDPTQKPLAKQEEPQKIYEEDFEPRKKVISRRGFLKILSGSATATGAVLAFPSLYEGAWNKLGKEELESKIRDLESELSAQYGIEVKVYKKNPEDRPIDIVRESLKDRSLYRSYESLLNVKEVLGHYPSELIKEKVEGIEIVYSVKSNYKMPSEKYAIQAITSFAGNITIRAGFQSALSYRATFGEVLEPEVLHHEIAHLLTEDIPVDEWKNLHPDVQYVGEEWVEFKQNKKKPKGFARPYSTSNVYDDIATTSELLFEDPDEVARLTKDDEILKKKFEYLKKWYIEKFGGKIRF